MKKLTDILVLGDERLYQVCPPVLQNELPLVSEWVKDMHNVMQQIGQKYNFGRP